MVDRGGRDADARQLAGDADGVGTGAAEDDRPAGRADELRGQTQPLTAADSPEELRTGGAPKPRHDRKRHVTCLPNLSLANCNLIAI